MKYIYRTYKFHLIGFWWTTVYKFYLFTSWLSTFVEHYSQTGKDPRPMLLNTCHTNNTIMIVVAIADKDMQPAHNMNIMMNKIPGSKPLDKDPKINLDKNYSGRRQAADLQLTKRLTSTHLH